MTETTGHVEAVRNHWWWRPGWRPGRHFYACHLTLEDQPELRQLVKHYQAKLSQIPNVDCIPMRWLHLTMQGIGFTDAVQSHELELIESRLRSTLRNAKRPQANFQIPTVKSEAIYLRAQPPDDLIELRLSMYEAVVSVLGSERFQEPAPNKQSFAPHVSVAYVNASGPARPILDALYSEPVAKPISVTFLAASLLTFHRDSQMYEWTSSRRLPIGASPEGGRDPEALQKKL